MKLLTSNVDELEASDVLIQRFWGIYQPQEILIKSAGLQPFLSRSEQAIHKTLGSVFSVARGLPFV